VYTLDANGYFSLLGRILMATIFLLSGFNKILHPLETQQFIASYGLDAPGFFLLGAIAIELGAGLSLLLGFATRLAALVLIGFTAMATLIFHTQFGDPMQVIQFLKNLAMMGGLVYVFAFGPGRISLDAKRWEPYVARRLDEAETGKRFGRTG
jgi:putative oxidoreductase